MLDLSTLFSASGLAEDLDVCRKSEEYQARGNIFNDEEAEVTQQPPQAVSSEPGFFDESLNMFNSLMGRILSGLPEMTSVDLSMDHVKAKGQ